MLKENHSLVIFVRNNLSQIRIISNILISTINKEILINVMNVLKHFYIKALLKNIRNNIIQTLR